MSMKLIQGDCLEIGKRISRQEALRISQETIERAETERELLDNLLYFEAEQ